jgi:bacillopeptidase F
VDVSGKESEFSNVLTVAFKSAPPSLNLDSPSDGQSFSKDQNTATVKGVTDPDVKVTVNGFWAITDSQGNFSYDLPLQNGDNKITVIATDMAGNKNEKDIKVTYSP